MENMAFRMSRRFLEIIVLMVLGLLVWAYFCPWPSTITTRFSLFGQNGSVVVSSSDAGYVSKTLIQNGDYVNKGQDLMEFKTNSQVRTVITASSSGYFLAEAAAREQNVSAGIPLGRLTETGPLVLNMFVTPEKLGQIQPGMGLILDLDAFPSQHYGAAQARISWVGSIPTRKAQDGTPLYEVQAQITAAPPALESRLRPGMLGTAQIITGHGRLIGRLFPAIGKVK